MDTSVPNLARELRAGVTGRVVEPADPDFDALRTVFPGGIDRRPALIVRPKNSTDVRHTIRVVRDAAATLSVRSGGHTIHSTAEGGVMLDLRELTALAIDHAAGTAWAETG